MNQAGTATLDEGILVYDGHETDPTIEGPKLYKRNGYYYIFAPAGGVPTGWQLVLRSKNIYGPYERKVVMDQGTTSVNGPHQGAWVTTILGEDWFLHFQDKGAYGRVVHLQPMKWIGDWPVIGEDPDGDGKGQPVMVYKKPSVTTAHIVQTPADTDEFNDGTLGKQWQWLANSKTGWYMMNKAAGFLRLYSIPLRDSARNLWESPNILLQKFPAEKFQVTTKCTFRPNEKIFNEKTGLAVMGLSYAYIGLKHSDNGIIVITGVCNDAYKGVQETENMIEKLETKDVYLRLEVMEKGICRFSYSTDGNKFKVAGNSFTAVEGRWKGAKTGLFSSSDVVSNDAGWADFDWIRFDPPQKVQNDDH
jgi:beta-xylosidase